MSREYAAWAEWWVKSKPKTWQKLHDARRSRLKNAQMRDSAVCREIGCAARKFKKQLEAEKQRTDKR
jgi:hypothetical protein